MKILIIDDSYEIRDILRLIVEKQNQPFTGKMEDEKEFLKNYNQAVVAKLEEKVKELEEAIAKNKQVEIAIWESEVRLANAQKIARIGNQDVTERKQIEESPQKSEAMFKGLFESSPDA